MPKQTMTVNRRALYMALDKMRFVVNDYAAPTEIARCVSLVAEEGKLKITAFDTYEEHHQISEIIDADGEMAVAINCDRLWCLVKTKTDDKSMLTFTVLEHDRVRIESSGAAQLIVLMPCHPIADFPTHLSRGPIAWTLFWAAPTTVFAGILAWIMQAASDDESRPNINCVRFADGHMISSDGYRAHKAQIPMGKEHPAFAVPKRGMEIMLRILERHDEQINRIAIHLDHERKHIRFDMKAGFHTATYTASSLTVRLAADAFPSAEIDDLIAEAHIREISVFAPNLIDALEQMRAARVDTLAPANITLKGAQLSIAIDDGDVHMNFNVPYVLKRNDSDGLEDFAMDINIKYLLEALEPMRGHATIKFDGPEDAIIIHSEEATAVVMPRRI
jgi:DNA polymerase III sliding clamp (beta) subunit (PCNA family)